MEAKYFASQGNRIITEIGHFKFEQILFHKNHSVWIFSQLQNLDLAVWKDSITKEYKRNLKIDY